MTSLGNILLVSITKSKVWYTGHKRNSDDRPVSDLITVLHIQMGRTSFAKKNKPQPGYRQY